MAQLNFLLLPPDVAKSLPCWLSQFSFSKIRTQWKNSIGPILFLYYEESLVSSNLNSKQLRFHGAHPNVQSSPATGVIPFILNLGTNAWFTSQKNRKKSCIKKRIEKKRWWLLINNAIVNLMIIDSIFKCIQLDMNFYLV